MYSDQINLVNEMLITFEGFQKNTQPPILEIVIETGIQ